MNRKSLLAVLGAAAIAAGLVMTSGPSASAQEIIIGPPSVFVATAQPVYYEGHAAYWYNNRWYWRGPHGWAYYHDEPVFLRDRRFHEAPRRYYYEHHEYHRR